MRKYISIIIVLLFLLSGCNQKEKYILSAEEWEAINKYRTFDIDNFWRYQQEYNFFFVREDSVFVEQFGDGNYYLEKRYYMNGKFCICDYLVFYPSGEIKRKKRYVSSFPDWTQVTSEIKGQDFPIGKEYNFNHDGKITEATEYDTSYKYTLKDVLLFIEEQRMKQLYLYRKTDTLKVPYWEILSEMSLNPLIYQKFHLHGITGEIIQDTTFLSPW